MQTAWDRLDAEMGPFLAECGVKPSDLEGSISDRSMRAWFGFSDPSNHASVVYFVRCTDRDLIKIGYTRHLKKRLGHIQHYSIDPIRFEAAMPGGRSTERAMHERFAHDRVVGEWFRTSEELEQLVRDVAAEHPQPGDLMVGLTT